jgi:hypothetical protein
MEDISSSTVQYLEADDGILEDIIVCLVSADGLPSQ